MTTTEREARVRQLRAATIAAIEQRDLLASEARQAVIAAWEAGRICRTGCADALTAWGLEPPPGDLTVAASGRMSYTRMHADQDEARAEAVDHVPAELYRLLPDVMIWPRRVVDVALIPDADDYLEAHPYRITVQVTLRKTVTVTSQAAAINRAQTTVTSRLPELVAADITLIGLSWEVYDGPDDLLHDADTDARDTTARLSDDGDDLAAATAARDAAVEALADLRHKIRRRAIRALVDDEIDGDYQDTAELVDQFLRGLGLAGLPWAHHVRVAVDLSVRAATREQAHRAAGDIWQAITVSPDDPKPWTAYGWPAADSRLREDGRWQMPCQCEYEMWLRGHTTPADASLAAEALVRADLTKALAGVDHDPAAVNATCEGFGIDLDLDPDTD